MTTFSRLAGLDGLRGIAVLAVIAYHLEFEDLLPAGFLGVDVFFCISGFIITALLLRRYESEGNFALRQFYARRAIRLMPPALAMMAVLAVMTPWWLPGALPRLVQDLPAALLQVLNWWQIVARQSYFDSIDHPPLLRHLWSLGIEWQFYLAWPLVLMALVRLGGRRAVGVFACLGALASTGLMAWMYATQTDGADPSRVYLGTDTHLMGLLAGSALAAFWNPWSPDGASKPDLGGNDLLGVGSLLALLAFMGLAHEGMAWMYQGGFLLAALITCAVVYVSTRPSSMPARWMSSRPMQWLGSRSYSLYLWHWPAMVMLAPAPHAGLGETAGYTALRLLVTGLCAELSYRLIEAPLRRDPELQTFRSAWRGGLAGAARALRPAQWAGMVGSLAIVGAMTSLYLQPMLPAGTWVAQVMAPATSSAPGVKASETASSLDSPTGIHAPASAQAEPTPAPAPVPPAGTGSRRAAGKARDELLPTDRVTVIGDSVMLGASEVLSRQMPGTTVNAQVGRQGSVGPRLIGQLKQTGQLGEAVVIHLGTNGYLSEDQYREMLRLLSDRRRVVVVNVYGDRRWTAGNNELIARLVREFDNVRLLDWHSIGQARPGYFVRDGIHLTRQGMEGLHRALRQALGLPATET